MRRATSSAEWIGGRKGVKTAEGFNHFPYGVIRPQRWRQVPRSGLESVTILDMGPQTFEGVVEHGQIRLKSEVHIPEGAKVYVIVPGMQAEHGRVHLRSPRLARREQAVDFEMEVAQP